MMPARRIVAICAGVVLVAGFSPGAARASNDPGFEKQWGLSTIGAPAAWAKTTGAGVRIGIVDTGIDLTHEDLAAHVVESTLCIETDGNPLKCEGSAQDDFGHGTHVAGIAAATKDNGLGVAGVAPAAQLVVAKVFKGATADEADTDPGAGGPGPGGGGADGDEPPLLGKVRVVAGLCRGRDARGQGQSGEHGNDTTPAGSHHRGPFGSRPGWRRSVVGKPGRQLGQNARLGQFTGW